MPRFDSDVALAFGLTIAAGASTCIGGAIVFFPQLRKLANDQVLSASLSLSAGVMLYVSFIEVFPEAEEKFIEDDHSEGISHLWASLAFFAGVAIVYLLDWIVHRINPHHEEDFAIDADAISNVGTPQELEATKQETNVVPAERLQKMGLMCAISIAIHNFPEGLATFIATLDDPKVGAVLAIAIAIHNIPEGIAVAFPIYYATGSKWKGFMWAFWSATTEPLGALLAWLFLADNMNQTVFGILFGLTAGMMVCIALKELIPVAHKHDATDKYSSNFLILGMVVMSLSLILFKNF